MDAATDLACQCFLFPTTGCDCGSAQDLFLQGHVAILPLFFFSFFVFPSSCLSLYTMSCFTFSICSSASVSASLFLGFVHHATTPEPLGGQVKYDNQSIDQYSLHCQLEAHIVSLVVQFYAAMYSRVPVV